MSHKINSKIDLNLKHTSISVLHNFCIHFTCVYPFYFCFHPYLGIQYDRIPIGSLVFVLWKRRYKIAAYCMVAVKHLHNKNSWSCLLSCSRCLARCSLGSPVSSSSTSYCVTCKSDYICFIRRFERDIYATMKIRGSGLLVSIWLEFYDKIMMIGQFNGFLLFHRKGRKWIMSNEHKVPESLYPFPPKIKHVQ